MRIKELTIRFVGRRKIIDPISGKEKLIRAAAPTRRVNGAMVFILPSDQIQKKGFTHKNADFLLKHYPREFKVLVGKG